MAHDNIHDLLARRFVGVPAIILDSVMDHLFGTDRTSHKSKQHGRLQPCGSEKFRQVQNENFVIFSRTIVVCRSRRFPCGSSQSTRGRRRPILRGKLHKATCTNGVLENVTEIFTRHLHHTRDRLDRDTLVRHPDGYHSEVVERQGCVHGIPRHKKSGPRGERRHGGRVAAVVTSPGMRELRWCRRAPCWGPQP